MEKEILYLLDSDKLDDIGGQPLHSDHRYIVNWKKSFIIIYQEYLWEKLGQINLQSN